jgi:hypothetical protein
MTSRIRSVRRSAMAIGVVVAAGSVIAPGPAGAATPIGETFAAPNNCAETSTNVQPEYAAPFGGVITSWSFQAGSSPPDVKLKVARHQGGNFFMIVGESEGGFKSPTAGQLNVYTDVRIPVQAGDILGVARGAQDSTDSCWRARDGYTEYDAVSEDPAPGTTEEFAGPFPGIQFNISAVLEPDCDSDGFGDETQDPDTSSCNPTELPAKADRTVTLDANKGKVEKGRKVRLTGQIDSPQNEAACEPNQTVELQRKAKNDPDTAFTTFGALQTDQAGNFADKVKVKKTYIYRAQIQQTDACDDEVSNTQTVRVQKPSAANEA